MGIQSYALTPGRLEKIKGHTIKAAVATEVLSRVGRQVKIEPNQGKTYVARKWVNYGAQATLGGQNTFFPTDSSQAGVNRGAQIVNANRTTEGVTPTVDSLVPLDYTCQIQEFACLYGFTNQTALFYEDDVPSIMKERVGPRMGLVNELYLYGILQSCTNIFYGGTGTSISTVNDKLTLNMVRKITRNLDANHGRPVTTLLSPSIKIKTEAVAPAYLVYVHTDLTPDVRDMQGFIDVKNYTNEQKLPGEIGSVETFRFIASPDLPGILSAGASAGTYTTLQSTLGTSVDVFPVIVMAADAISQIAVRGRESTDITFIPPELKSKSDPLNQKGFAGSLWYKAAFIENDGWMAVAYVGTQKIS